MVGGGHQEIADAAALEFGRAANDSQGVWCDPRFDAGGSCGFLG
jgi:hypothetical protein